MGLTIEEAAECTGIGRNTECGSWWTGASCPSSRSVRKTIIRRDTLERLYDRQSRDGILPTPERRPQGGMTIRFSFRQVTLSPRRLRAKYTPRTNLRVCTLGISPLQGAMYHSFGQCAAAMIHEKTARCFLRCPSAYAAETAATDKSVAERVCPSREERSLCQDTVIYTDVEATQCQGKNIVYHKPRKTRKSLCYLSHRRQ